MLIRTGRVQTGSTQDRRVDVLQLDDFTAHLIAFQSGTGNKQRNANTGIVVERVLKDQPVIEKQVAMIGQS